MLSRPAFEVAGLALTPAWITLVAAGIYYVLLDIGLGLSLTVIIGAMTWAGTQIAGMSTVTWLVTGISMFVVGWIIQFVGHYYEGKKPAFADDLVGLLIGPMFVSAEALFAIGMAQPLRHELERRAGPTVLRDLAHPVA